MPTKPIPDGYSTITPYLILKGAAAALDYYKKAFGAEEIMRYADPSGAVMHAEIKIGNSIIMLGEENLQEGFQSAKTLGGAAVGLHLYVEDSDKWFARALKAGGKEQRPMQDQFYGDRSGTLVDPFGQLWTISTHKEDVSPDEMKRRMKAMMSQK